MRSQATIHAALRDLKALTRRTIDETELRDYRTRWNGLIVIAAVPLSLLFAWGFLHLVVALIFSGPGVAR